MQKTTPMVMRRHVLAMAITAALFSQASMAVEKEPKIMVIGQSEDADVVIKQEAIDNYQAADLEDMFKHSPDVNVGGGFSTAQKIYVRGIEDTNINTTIDGAPQAGYLFHHQGRLGIEPELIKRVEVKAGAGLATDGAGALGGAVRFVTKDPQDLLRDDEQAGALVKLGYFDNTEAVKVSGTVFGRLSERVSVLASISRQDSENIVDAEGTEQKNTASEIDSALVKVVGQLSANEKLTLSHDVRNDDGRRNVRPHFISAGWNPANEQESHRETTNLKYHLNKSDNLNLQASLYHNDAYMTQDPDDDPKDGAGVKSTGLDLRNTQKIGDHKLTYGVDHRQDTGYYINNTKPEFKDEEVSITGVYVQDEILLNEKLVMTAGARYDSYDMDDNIGQSFKDDGVSPNIGFNYAINDALDVHIGYAKAFRGVGVKEAYLLNFATNDPNRKAEEADNIEIGFDYSQDRLRFGAKAFVSNIENTTKRVKRSVVGNAGDVENKGISAYVGYNWQHTDLNVTFSASRPELEGEPLDDGDMGIGSSTGDTLTVALDHAMPEKNVKVGWSAELVKRLTDVPDDRTEKAGYGVHDVYAKWHPQGNEDLSVTLAIKNILDKQYISHASYGYNQEDKETLGLFEAGRDVRLTFAARF